MSHELSGTQSHTPMLSHMQLTPITGHLCNRFAELGIGWALTGQTSTEKTKRSTVWLDMHCLTLRFWSAKTNLPHQGSTPGQVAGGTNPRPPQQGSAFFIHAQQYTRECIPLGHGWPHQHKGMVSLNISLFESVALLVCHQRMKCPCQSQTRPKKTNESTHEVSMCK